MNCHGEWSFDGVRLDSFGIVTELDSYLDMPSKRGDDVLIPMRHGKLWVPKYFDSRVVSFGIEIPSGGILELEATIDSLKTLVGSRTQKVLMNSAFAGGPRSALAEVVNQLGVTRDPDPLVAKVVLDFNLAYPFFYGSMPRWDIFDIPNTMYDFDNPGTAEECKAIVTFTDMLDRPIFTNPTAGCTLQYDDVLGIGDSVIIDCWNKTAVDGLGNNVVGKIVHSGDSPFMAFAPGHQFLYLSDAAGADTGAGTVRIDYYPPYL